MAGIGKFLVTQMAAVVELEAGLVSQRTRAALAAARARGQRLGWANPARQDQAQATTRAADVNRAEADRHAANVVPIVSAIQAAGITSLAAIAGALNARGVPTARGGRWWPTSVKNLLRRESPATA